MKSQRRGRLCNTERVPEYSTRARYPEKKVVNNYILIFVVRRLINDRREVTRAESAASVFRIEN